MDKTDIFVYKTHANEAGNAYFFILFYSRINHMIKTINKSKLSRYLIAATTVHDILMDPEEDDNEDRYLSQYHDGDFLVHDRLYIYEIYCDRITEESDIVSIDELDVIIEIVYGAIPITASVTYRDSGDTSNLVLYLFPPLTVCGERIKSINHLMRYTLDGHEGKKSNNISSKINAPSAEILSVA